MSEGWTHKAGIFHVKRAMEDGARSPEQQRTNFRSKRWADQPTHPHPSPPLPARGDPTHLPPGVPMETVVGQHQSPSQQRCHDAIRPAGAQSGSGVFANRPPPPPPPPPPADPRIQSPTELSGMFSSQASSRDSVFSDGWDRERSWSAMQLSNAASPLSLSRAVSPCSSVRSGAFTPTVVRLRRHALASGAALLHAPEAASSSCLSSCESLASSVGARSPPPPPPPPRRHRPPLTRLSLLTAILRKGRLPVLSPTVRRPYSPCWPINHVTLTSCTACSAASSLAPVSPRPPSSPPQGGRAEEGPAGPRSPGCSDPVRRRPALPAVRPARDGSASTPRPTYTPPALTHNPPAGKEPKFQTVYSRPVTSPVPHRATGGECCVALPHVPLPLPPSPPSQLRAATTASGANLAAAPQGAESTRLRISRPWCCTGPLPLGPKWGANQADPGCPVDRPQEIGRTKHKQPSHETSGLGNISAQRARSPATLPGSGRLDCLSPPPRVLPSCLKKSQTPAARSQPEPPKYPPAKTSVPGYAAAPVPVPSDSPRDGVSSAPSASCLSPSRYTPIAFPGWPSPYSSRTSTPDRFTLTPSPASQARDLTPCTSPSPSARSTPSPRPGSGWSDCAHGEGKKRKPHKIKSIYKSLAAIPTNTLLLDQQVIDQQVGREDHRSGTGAAEDPHAEMCSPAQLRQESEELYAVIDKILEDAAPKSKESSSSLAQPSGGSAPLVTGAQNIPHNSSARPLGRETKYATVRSPPPPASPLERTPAENQTKPGVIRPTVTGVQRLRVEEYGGHDQCNPFARYLLDTPAAAGSTPESSLLNRNRDVGRLGSRSPTQSLQESPEDPGTTPTSALFIMEEACPHPVKPASWQGTSTPFSRAEALPEVSETRI